MLQIKDIKLTQFKNYNCRNFEFTRRIVCICGNNGTGKTSLLDAIHYLCFTKSYFIRSDSNSAHQGQNGFRIEGKFFLNGKEEKALCILREPGKKEFSVNGDTYEKFSQHIGHYPCVIIAPDDAQLITGGSEERRKFLDALLSQLDAEYLKSLITYNKILQQRNALLRSFAESGINDFSVMDILDKQLIEPGSFIFNARKKFLTRFFPMVIRLYLEIAQQPEEIQFLFESELLNGSFGELLKNSRQKDCRAQRSTCGIHKDDLEIFLGKLLFRNIASQGQRKSLLFALKLAEMEILKKEKGFTPLLLLDDVFEKLDESRIANLLQYVCINNEGQVFITDTNRERMEQHLKSMATTYQLIEL
ncbi:MAG: DNA replication and repair protein RecF [Bacteroidetes bacterium]|nr:DNA replication and repair protein RecF [Bacteroidota bacterium]MBS1931755.1 DNA replication and repair protein RecF [Bacteroidota bacterium]